MLDWHMQKGDENYTVNRGIALHKMIRLLTSSTINGGYSIVFITFLHMPVHIGIYQTEDNRLITH